MGEYAGLREREVLALESIAESLGKVAESLAWERAPVAPAGEPHSPVGPCECGYCRAHRVP